jgi:hypothetical protein
MNLTDVINLVPEYCGREASMPDSWITRRVMHFRTTGSFPQHNRKEEMDNAPEQDKIKELILKVGLYAVSVMISQEYGVDLAHPDKDVVNEQLSKLTEEDVRRVLDDGFGALNSHQAEMNNIEEMQDWEEWRVWHGRN